MFKNNKIKKYISSVLTLALISASLMVGWVAFGDDLVAINQAYFPDDNWRAIVSSKDFDKNGDGYLSADERNKYSLDISGYVEDFFGEDGVIEDLTGVEHFTSVQRLYVGGIGLKTLDVSMLNNLTQLTCNGNNLTSLKIGSKPKLTMLNCRSNELQTLNIGGCYSLKTLYCDTNHLQSLNVTGNSELQTLICYDNDLTNLDVSSNSLLTTLYCSNNHLTELDLSYNTKLSEVTQNMIGGQTTSGTARFSGGTVNVPFSISKKSNVVATSLDTVEDNGSSDSSETRTVLGYSSIGNFFTKDVKNFKLDGHEGDTIEYEYSVGNTQCENMNVFVSVNRSFYQIDFYTNDTKTALISRQFINAGKSATAPTITSYPDDKLFGGWIGEYENVQADADVYIRWINEHIWRVSKFDNGEVTIHCDDCGDEYSYQFSEILNLTEENVDFVPVLDTVKDGIINAKDYAKFANQFR